MVKNIVFVLGLLITPNLFAQNYTTISSIQLSRWRAPPTISDEIIFLRNYGGQITYVTGMDLTLDSNLEGGFWSDTRDGELVYKHTNVKVEVINDLFVKITFTGFINEVGYFCRQLGGPYYGLYAYTAPDITATFYGDTEEATTDFWTYMQCHIYVAPSAVNYTTNVIVDGTPETPQEVNPTITGPGMNEEGKVALEPETLADYPLQTNKYWNDFGIKVSYLDVQQTDPLGSSTPTYAFGQFHKFHEAPNTPLVWYKTSDIKDMVDALMVGFATLTAFMMPYNELRKGAK